eukprot:469208-Prymnesium_polylepis.1
MRVMPVLVSANCAWKVNDQRAIQFQTLIIDAGVIRARHDPRPVRRKAHGAHRVTHLVLHQRKRRCVCATHTHTTQPLPTADAISTHEQGESEVALTPQLDAGVIRSRHDSRPIRREAHIIHPAAVSTHHLRHERQRRCICAPDNHISAAPRPPPVPGAHGRSTS